MRPVFLSVLVLLLVSGCIGESPLGEDPGEGAERAVAAPRPVVVAVIDTGINVYHDRFQRETPLEPAALATFVNTLDDAAPVAVDLTRNGTYEERREADKELWDGLEEQTLYHFTGTNVLGISFDDRDDHPVLDDGSHGTGTTAAVFDVDPRLVVVLIEGIGPDAEAWAAAQPWIDVVSMSYGPVGSLPLTGALFGLTTSEATKQMWASGKLPIGAIDNTPAPSTFDETGGPPWVIGVAGDHPNGCRATISGNLPDFTSDFTQDLPLANATEGNRSMSGTSFATPRTAGSFGAVLRELRDRYGAPPATAADSVLAYGPGNTTLTNGDLRAAFEKTATYYPTDPSCAAGTINPVAPWVQQGWGHVGPEMVPDALGALTGEGDVQKPMPARLWNEQAMELRRAYWGS